MYPDVEVCSPIAQRIHRRVRVYMIRMIQFYCSQNDTDGRYEYRLISQTTVFRVSTKTAKSQPGHFANDAKLKLGYPYTTYTSTAQGLHTMTWAGGLGR